MDIMNISLWEGGGFEITRFMLLYPPIYRGCLMWTHIYSCLSYFIILNYTTSFIWEIVWNVRTWIASLFCVLYGLDFRKKTNYVGKLKSVQGLKV